jgi:hypothetical protein
MLILAVLLALPAGARAGELMDALSPKARTSVERVVRYAVEYDNCRGDQEMGDEEADFFVELLSESIKEHPQYATLDAEGRQVLLLNLILEMQQEVLAAPAPDCAVVRAAGQRA